MAKMKRNKSDEDQRLALLAQELGVAFMVVLVNEYNFSAEEANIAIGKVLGRAQETRTAITAATIVSAFEIGGTND